MLVLLYERGPLTEGIFQTSASKKQCRELREQLNSGASLRLDCMSVVLVASVFKVRKVLPLIYSGLP